MKSAKARVIHQNREKGNSRSSPTFDSWRRDKGVEDIRILAGEKRLQRRARKWLRPWAAHWQLYLAIQHDRYWVKRAALIFVERLQNSRAAYQKAQEIVARMAAQLKPGVRFTAIDEGRASNSANSTQPRRCTASATASASTVGGAVPDGRRRSAGRITSVGAAVLTKT